MINSLHSIPCIAYVTTLLDRCKQHRGASLKTHARGILKRKRFGYAIFAFRILRTRKSIQFSSPTQPLFSIHHVQISLSKLYSDQIWSISKLNSLLFATRTTLPTKHGASVNSIRYSPRHERPYQPNMERQ